MAYASARCLRAEISAVTTSALYIMPLKPTLKNAWAAAYVATFWQVLQLTISFRLRLSQVKGRFFAYAMRTIPRVETAAMIPNPSPRPQISNIFAIGNRKAALIHSETVYITGIKECASKLLVTYAVRFPESDIWKALTKYNSTILHDMIISVSGAI